MTKVFSRTVIAAVFALLTAAILALLASLMDGAPSQAELEEARIFNSDDAQWFGEDPDFGYLIRFQGLGSDQEGAYANVELNGSLKKVRAGELISPPCLMLSEILEDGLLIDQCGGYALVPEGDSVASPQQYSRRAGAETLSSPARPEVIDLRSDRRVAALARDYHQRLYQRPLSLRGQIKVDVQRDSGGERRYFIFPGDDKRLFRQLPIRSGDEVRAINGISLAERESFSDLYKHLADANHLTVTLERGDSELVLLLGL